LHNSEDRTTFRKFLGSNKSKEHTWHLRSSQNKNGGAFAPGFNPNSDDDDSSDEDFQVRKTRVKTMELDNSEDSEDDEEDSDEESSSDGEDVEVVDVKKKPAVKGKRTER
jgi:hypothetical protein